MRFFFHYFLVLFISLISTVSADHFQKNTELIEKFKANNLRLIVLCNFQGTNNALNIVTSSRSPAYELTADGLNLLHDTIPAFINQNITHIYTAPAYRAQQTTNALGKALELAPGALLLESRLGVQNFGIAEKEDFNLYKARFTSEQEMLEGIPPDGESGLSVFNRTHAFLVTLEDLKNQTLLVITHAFNFCHLSKCLTGTYNQVPSPGTYVIYDFNVDETTN